MGATQVTSNRSETDKMAQLVQHKTQSIPSRLPLVLGQWNQLTLCTKISLPGFHCISLTPFITSSPKSPLQINFDHPKYLVRNVLVFPGHRVKISQCGMARPLYASDYSPLGPGGKLVPLRWMAWESLLLDVYTSKSDVWSFGVALWEILTFAREQPHEAAA